MTKFALHLVTFTEVIINGKFHFYVLKLYFENVNKDGQILKVIQQNT